MSFIYEKIGAICSKLEKYIYEEVYTIKNIEYAPCEYKEQYESENVPSKNLAWSKFEENMRFGMKDKHFWFKFHISTPSKSNNKECIFNLVTAQNGEGDVLNPQGLIYLNGKMIQGLDINHTEVLLDFNTEYDVLIYMYTGMYEQWFDFKPSVRLIEKTIEKLYYDIHVPYDGLKFLSKESTDYIETIKILNEATLRLDFRVPKSKEFYESIISATEYLDKNFYNGICGKSDITVNCIGHTHIDVAWLWTIAQTREKAQRSFSTAINLMKQYPEYKFMSSQPQLYAYVKQSAPEIYEQIKKAVEKNRWEVEGAMWLEADCNLTGGESLVRQIMFGKRFMMKEFNIDSKTLWLPDVFGYSAAMPQILKKSGVDNFVTSKISWNETNKMPYDIFMWQGIDGSEVFTSFMTARDAKPFGENDGDDSATTYVGYIRPSQILGTWKRFQQKEYSNETLITFGYGDGGGGPTKDMLEQQRRLSYGLPGFPKTQINYAGNYLNKLKNDFNKNSKHLKKTPKWVGELYLEFHRGTYTSIAKNKRKNRKSEFAYQNTELLSVTDMLLCKGEYPQEKINKGWQEILLNQFHDIIPGSSIFEVYEDSDKSYKRILANAKEIQKSKLANIKKHINTNGGILVFNPNGFKTDGPVVVDGRTVFAENIPPMGYRVIAKAADTNTIQLSEKCIENKFFKISFDNGKILSIYDKKNNREIVREGEYANELKVYEDIPRCYDAWEISDYYKQKMWTVDEVLQTELINDGIRAGIRLVKKFLNSVLEQKIWLYEEIDRIDFETVIDWQQEHMLVKAAFPIDINANEATYDIQFGSIKRPTHENTGWDAAKFEVCAHKWADISDTGYGVSILNDCKYGYSAEGSTLALTLLKCATSPNPEADKGIHRFTYSLHSHPGNVYSGDTIHCAYELNQPLIAEPIKKTVGHLPDNFSLVSFDCDNIIAETVKKAEDSDGIIIRIYESKNKRCRTSLTLGIDIDKAYLCDLMENEQEEISVNNHRNITLPIGNFEIITLKIIPSTIDNCTD